MKIEYDHQANALYLYLSSTKKKVWRSKEIEPGVILDLDKQGRVIGVEMLNITKKFKPSELFQFSVRHIGEVARAA